MGIDIVFCCITSICAHCRLQWPTMCVAPESCDMALVFLLFSVVSIQMDFNKNATPQKNISNWKR